MSYANRVEDVVLSVAESGLGAVTLAGTPPIRRQGLAKLGGVGTKFDYALEQGALWEQGKATVTGVNTFSRMPTDSSAGGVLEPFSAGAIFMHDVSANTLNTTLVNPNDLGFDIVLCAGQSNMVGSEAAVTTLDVSDPRVFMFGGYSAESTTYRKMALAIDPLRHYAGASSGMGPATWFGKSYASIIPSNRKVLLVPVAQGGTTLVAQTAPWSPGDGSAGNVLYENAIAQANAAVAAAVAMYPNSRFVGTIWLQGESDGDWTVSKANYVAALKTLIQGFRSRITGASKSWFTILGMVRENVVSPPVGQYGGYATIDDAHQQVAAEVARAAYTPGILGYQFNPLHYNASGARIMGCNAASVVPIAMVSNGNDTTAPTILRASVAAATPSVVAVTLSEPLMPGFVPAASAFTVTGHTVTAVSVVGNVVYLTVSVAFVNGEVARTVTYTVPGVNGLRDLAGNMMINSSAVNITNNVAAGDTTAPAFVSAMVSNSAPNQIVITMSEALANSIPPNSALVASGNNAVTGVAVSGVTVTVTATSAYVFGDTVTIQHIQPATNPRLQDASGNPTASFGPVSVTNNVAQVGDSLAPVLSNPTATKTGNSTAIGTVSTANDAAGTLYFRATANPTENEATVKAGGTQAVSATGVQNVTFNALPAATTLYAHFVHTDPSGNNSNVVSSAAFTTDAAAAQTPRLILRNNISESPTAPYVYGGTSGGGFSATAVGGRSEFGLQAGQDGYFEFKVNTFAGEIIFGVDPAATLQPYTTLDYAVHCTGNQGYKGRTNNVADAAIGTTGSATDIVRMTRTGTTLVGAVSKDGGAQFIPIRTWTGVSTGVLHFHVLLALTANIGTLAQSGLA